MSTLTKGIALGTLASTSASAPALIVNTLTNNPAAPIGLSERLWAMHVLQMQAALPGRSFVPASVAMRDLRQVKDVDEARLLGLAAAAADRTIPLEEWAQRGMPDAGRAWSPDDYTGAATLLEAAAKESPARLPRGSSAVSGALYRRLVDPANLGAVRTGPLESVQGVDEVVELGRA